MLSQVSDLKFCLWAALCIALLTITIMKQGFSVTWIDKLIVLQSPDETWSKEAINCTWPELKLMDPPGPTTGLVSIPGSGNTWVRHLLQLSTGILTGSIFHDGMLKRSGFAGEGITDGSVIAIKDHMIFNRTYDRFVAIIRHPLHGGLSEFNRNRTANHLEHANMTVFMESWHEYFTKYYMQKYMWFMSGLVKMKNSAADRLCILQYEKLVEDVINELRPCVEFLGFHIDDHLAKCIRKDGEGKFHRKPMAANELRMIFSHSFTDDDLKHYQELHDDFVSKLGKAK